MFLIQNTLVSLDILEKEFCCDLDKCRGCCCIEGDAGAPLEADEERKIQEILPILLPEMTKEARAVVEQQGIAYNDPTGERVTSIVNGKDCVFTCYNAEGCCFCATDKAFREGRTAWCKPISCALYPIREKQFSNGTVGLQYHRWSVCHAAVKKGRELQLPIYKFLKDPLIRRFGQSWYDELCEVADSILAND